MKRPSKSGVKADGSKRTAAEIKVATRCDRECNFLGKHPGSFLKDPQTETNHITLKCMRRNILLLMVVTSMADHMLVLPQILSTMGMLKAAERMKPGRHPERRS